MLASWTICENFRFHHEQIQQHGQLLATWPGLDSADPPTLCFRENDQFWILRADQGGIRFARRERNLCAYPRIGVDPEQFKRMAFHDWLPFVYSFWGLQVLHASGAVHVSSSQVVVFSGASGAGKSTFGYGLGCRPGWRQIADDSLAFEVQHDSIRLLPIPNQVNLRPASLKHYGDRGVSREFLEWIDSRPEVKRILLLEPNDDPSSPLCLASMSPAHAYMSLLEQAYTLGVDAEGKAVSGFERPHDNRQRIEEYLSLASQVPVFRLQYPRKFAALDEAFSLIESDLALPRAD